jgi:Family of unknown function (DUF6364)
MDSKITLSFDKNVIEKAKEYASENNISLSRLTEFLLTKVTSKSYKSLEEYPISDWVTHLSAGNATYNVKRNNKETKSAFFNAKK